MKSASSSGSARSVVFVAGAVRVASIRPLRLAFGRRVAFGLPSERATIALDRHSRKTV